MGASHIGTMLGAWGSLLTIISRQPLRVDGYDPLGIHHTYCQQVSARIFAVLGIASQRVAACAVHIKYQPTHTFHFHYSLDLGVVSYDLRAPGRR
jgi:hypothetical protein